MSVYPDLKELYRLLERAERAIMEAGMVQPTPPEAVVAAREIVQVRVWLEAAGFKPKPIRRRGSRHPGNAPAATADAPPGSPQ